MPINIYKYVYLPLGVEPVHYPGHPAAPGGRGDEGRQEHGAARTAAGRNGGYGVGCRVVIIMTFSLASA